MSEKLKMREIYAGEELDDIVAMGLDFGDGSISYAVLNDGKIEARKIDKLNQRPNIISCYEKEFCSEERFADEICNWEHDPEPLAEYVNGARCYCNFKCAPDSAKFRAKYLFKSGDGKAIFESCYTNGELMERAFQVIVSTIISKEKSLLEGKRLLLVVGCPSGGLWKPGKYAKFLKNALEKGALKYANGKNKGNLKHLGEYCKDCEKFPIEVVVVPESNAAVAYETGYNRINIKDEKIITLIDMGSSTLDFTLVVDGKIVDTYTRNLGGEQFEMLMYKKMMETFDEDYPGQEFVDPSYIKFGLRTEKENFYGESGKKRKKTTFETTLKENNETYEFDITKSFMEDVVYNTREAVIPGSMMAGVRNLSGLSIMEAYKTVFSLAKEKFISTLEENGRSYKPDSVIATGGVSVVEDLQKLICEVFEIKAISAEEENPEEEGALERAESPELSVACGLAQVGGTEMNKLRRIYKLIPNIDDEFLYAGIRGLILDAVSKVMASREVERVDKTLKEWANDNKDASVTDWFKLYKKEKISTEGIIGPAIEKVWSDCKMGTKLNDSVNEYFEAMFGEGLQVLFDMDNIDIAAVFEGIVFETPELAIENYFSHVGFSPEYYTKKRKTNERVDWYHSKREFYADFIKDKDKVCGKIAGKYRSTLSLQTFVPEGKTDARYFDLFMVEKLKETVIEQIEDYIDSLTMYFYMNKEKGQ